MNDSIDSVCSLIPMNDSIDSVYSLIPMNDSIDSVDSLIPMNHCEYHYGSINYMKYIFNFDLVK